MRPRAPLRRLAIVLLGLVGLAGLAAWFALARWLPLHGAAWLEERVEAALSIEAEVGSLRYVPFRGIVLQDVTITEPTTGTAWVVAPVLRARVGWLSLLLGRVALRCEGAVTAPLATELTFGVRSDLRGRTVTLDLHTSDARLGSLIPSLRQALPPGLDESRLSASLRLRRVPERPARLTGAVAFSPLMWTAQGRRASVEVTVDGEVRFTRPQPTMDLRAVLRDGTAEGWPRLGAVDEIEGRLRLLNETLTIERLTAQALEAPWRLEGVITPVTDPALEALLTARVPLSTVSRLMPDAASAWTLAAGDMDLRTVCRGPLAPAQLDCVADIGVRDGSVQAPLLDEPLTELAGALHYDVFAQHLRVTGLSGRAGAGRFTLEGEVVLPEPTRAHLQLQVEDVSLASAQLPMPVRGLTGRIEVHPAAVTARDLQVIVGDEPLTVTISLARETPPALSGVVAFSGGLLELRARLEADRVDVEEAHLALARTDVRAGGTWPRAAGQPARWSARGTVELSELADLPFLEAPLLTAWTPRGEVAGELSVEGPPRDWRAAAVRARFTGNALRVGEIPIDEGAVELEQRARRMHVRLSNARLAGGRTWGELQIVYGRTPAGDQYALTLDATTVRLDELAERIPAWRELKVSGEASTHATLAGTWPDRATWVGEGWVRASGANLGQMPLLDTVFRGFFGGLADALGLQRLRRAQITEASARWQLQQERIYTQDLRLGGQAGGQPVAVYAAGSAGLDRTLDFVLEPEFAEAPTPQTPAADTLADLALRAAGQLDRMRQLIGRHRLTGTLTAPVYRFELGAAESAPASAPAIGTLLQRALEGPP